ncbi:hypothetical protein HG530_014771 [Fusarium avenaceum]|nr:hypothetical protein HG530_014771 [Fusarium avenaceum]
MMTHVEAFNRFLEELIPWQLGSVIPLGLKKSSDGEHEETLGIPQLRNFVISCVIVEEQGKIVRECSRVEKVLRYTHIQNNNAQHAVGIFLCGPVLDLVRAQLAVTAEPWRSIVCLTGREKWIGA